MPVNRLLPFALLPLVAACAIAPAPIQQGLADIGLYEPPPPAVPEPVPSPALPREVIDALPPGAPTQTVLLGPDGCYIFTVEVTVPPSGYPVRDANGVPLCANNTSEPVFTNNYAGATPLAQPGVGNDALAGGTSLAPGTIPDLGT